MNWILERIKQNNRIRIIFLLIMMIQFQLLDGIMTQIFVRNGLVKEGNAFVADLITKGEFLITKFIGLIICVLILWFLYKIFPRLIYAATTLIVIFYSAVIIWNFLILFQTTI
jgi:hypothetical protein